jgi:hypothetical protein
MAKTQGEIKKELIGLQEQYNRLVKKGAELTQEEVEKQIKLQKEIKESVNELKEANKERLRSIANEESSIKGMGSIYSELQENQKKTNDMASGFTDGFQRRIIKLNSINRSISQLDVNDHHQRAQLMSDRAELMKGMNFLGKENVKTLKEGNDLADKYANMSESSKKALQAQHDAADKVKQTLQGISETAQTVVSRLFSVKGLFGGLFFAAGSFAEKLVAANKELGQVGTLTDGAANRAAGLSFFFGDSVQALKGLSQELGGTEGLSTSVQLQTNLIASNLGISAQEAATLTATMSRLNGGSLETAGNLADAARDFARINNIPVSQMMGDLAASTEQFALFGKKGGQNIIEAAGYAAKLGVSLGQASGIAENLLDFENSITKELELGARLGKNINLSKARQLAYEGDIAGATKATLDQLGGIDAFNKMDYFQKKATADLLGVSVAELQKMATNQEKANAIARLGQGDFSNLAESAKALVSQFGPKAMKGIGTFLMLSSQANQSFKLMGRMPIFQKLADNKLGRGVSKFFGGGASKIAEQTPNIPKPKGGGFKSITESISKINPAKILAGAAALVIVASSVFVFGKAVQEFMKVSWGAVGKSVVSMLALVGAVALLGAIMTSGVGAIAILAGAAAMLVVASSIFVLGKALQEVGKGFDMLSQVPSLVSSLVSNIAPIALLSLAFMGLAASLMFLGSAGLFALPSLLGIAAAASGIALVAELFGLGGESGSETTAIEEGGGSNFETNVLSKIDELIVAVNNGMQVNLDGRRVQQGLDNRSKRGLGENRLVN